MGELLNAANNSERERLCFVYCFFDVVSRSTEPCWRAERGGGTSTSSQGMSPRVSPFSAQILLWFLALMPKTVLRDIPGRCVGGARREDSASWSVMEKLRTSGISYLVGVFECGESEHRNDLRLPFFGQLPRAILWPLRPGRLCMLLHRCLLYTSPSPRD